MGAKAARGVGTGWVVRAASALFCVLSAALSEGPLLVAAAVARPQLHEGAVGGTCSGHIQAET